MATICLAIWQDFVWQFGNDLFGDLVEKCVDTGTLTYQKFLTQTQELLGQIKHTEFYKQLKRYKMRADDNLLFIYMAYLFVENSDDCISFDDLCSIYDERDDFEHHCRKEVVLQRRRSQAGGRTLVFAA